MDSEISAETSQALVIAKETDDYRIVTDDADNWHLVATRHIARGELVVPPGSVTHIDVCGVEFVDVILEETQERKRVYTAISAVPSDAGCAPTALEIPWCFMNHSCEPNVHDRWYPEAPATIENADTEATRDIAEGEELTYDYAFEQYYYRSHFDCQCGADACRGTISGFKGLSRKQQEQMLSKATPYVQERHRRESMLKSAGVNSQGRHLVVDYWDCDVDVLNDDAQLTSLLTKAAHAAGAKVMSTHAHCFDHQGVTAVAILAESHIAIHTWPGTGYAGVDVYTCGGCDPSLAHNVMNEGLFAGRAETMELARGRVDSKGSIKADSYEAPLHSGVNDDNTWFFEGSVPGQRHGNVCHGFHLSDVVYRERTPFQDCVILDNSMYGRVLVLDGIVQLSTSDEYIYHEMLVHPVMFNHARPRRVVIVGGGDGGTLREVLQHDPEEVVMIDIDEQVVRAAAEHLPSVSAGAFTDPRVTLLFEDANKALHRYKDEFDVAIIDCNSAIGTSEPLFEETFYSAVERSLSLDGVCAVQGGSMLDGDSLKRTRVRMESHLGRTTGFRLTMPSYHSGEYVFFAASRSHEPSGPDVATLAELQSQRGVITKYWSPAMHHASQVLPPSSRLW